MDVREDQSVSSAHRIEEYDPDDHDRPVGLLTPDIRRALSNSELFDAENAFTETRIDINEFRERIIHAFLDFHLLAVKLDADSLEHIFYEGGTPRDFDPGVPSVTEAAVEDIIALIYRGVQTNAVFEELLEAGIERGHHLEGERFDGHITITEENVEPAHDIATRLDEQGVEDVTPRELQILYFAGVITTDEYRALFEEKFDFL